MDGDQIRLVHISHTPITLAPVSLQITNDLFGIGEEAVSIKATLASHLPEVFCRIWHLAVGRCAIIARAATLGWLPRHHRAGPSASLDKSVSFI